LIEGKNFNIIDTKKGANCIKVDNLNNIQDDLFVEISYRLRTSLTVIRGFTELLLNSDDLTDIQRENLEIILRNELKLERLAHELEELISR